MKNYFLYSLAFLLMGCATPNEKLKTAIYNHQATAEVIDDHLAQGAKLNVASGKYGLNTVLGYCIDQSSDVWGCSFDTFKALIERGSDPSKIWMSDDGKWGPQHAIHRLSNKGRNKEIRYLIEELNVPVDIIGYEHIGTPLAIAYQFNEFETIKLLYELGADPSKLTLYGRPATVDDLIDAGVALQKRSDERTRQKQTQEEDSSLFTKALVIAGVAVIAGESDISLANQIEVVSAVTTDVINDTNGENTQQVYQKAKQQAEAINQTSSQTSLNSQLPTNTGSKKVAPSNQTTSVKLCRASTWGAYRTIYWDGMSLQCANGSSPIFDNLTFWMGQYCEENQPRKDPNKINRCNGTAMEDARSAAKASMPQEAWPKWGL